MAQTCYTGIQGSGKSFEVVRGVILPNVAKGRRVVTNVAGLQVDLINQYCVDKLGADPEKLGEIVHITNEQVTKPGFFPEENKDNSAAVVQGGDIIILDECWRWYVTGEKLPDGHLTFFRMHRHFTHPDTGQCCDIVLIVQDIGDLQRKVLATVEKSFLMKKHKDLGLSDRYVVSIYAGKRQTARSLTEESNYKYDSAIFSLYSSYSQSTAATKLEEQADKRGNLFNRKLFRIGIPLAVICLIGAVYNTWSFFHPQQNKPVATADKVSEKSGASGQADQTKPVSGVSDVWRIVGTVTIAGRLLFMLVDGSGRMRYVENPPAFKVSSLEVELALPTGEVVTRWSGSVAAPVGSMLPGMKR